jgi:peptide/nickel transport system substrate-binding protein
VPKAEVAICPTVGWGKDFFDSQSMITPVFYGPNIVPSGNTNMAQANDPTLNKEMEQAAQLTSTAQRSSAWANLDKQITSQVFVVTWLWDNEVVFASSNVAGVTSPFNSNAWDLTWSSLK